MNWKYTDSKRKRKQDFYALMQWKAREDEIMMIDKICMIRIEDKKDEKILIMKFRVTILRKKQNMKKIHGEEDKKMKT